MSFCNIGCISQMLSNIVIRQKVFTSKVPFIKSCFLSNLIFHQVLSYRIILILDHTEPTLDHMGPYKTIQGPKGPYQIRRDHTGPYETIRGQTGHMRPYGTKPDHTGPNQTILDHNRPYRTKWDHTGP